jgi:HEAT repeat protein
MSKVADYRAELAGLPPGQWDAFLAAHSGLPGPRGNLELIQAVADEGDAARLHRYAAGADEYLACCGTVGLGRLLAEGDGTVEPALHGLAGDERWRVREAAAMALQRVGDADLAAMLAIAERWADDPSWLVRRAAIAGPCEPRLLRDPATVERVLTVLDTVTSAVESALPEQRRDPALRALRKGLGYCWSVAVAAAPRLGLARFARWQGSDDADVQWIVRENLKKNRLRKVIDAG